jgi:hypothetical protein
MESNKRKDSKIRKGEDRGYYRPIIHISFKDGCPLKKEDKKLVKFKKNKNYTEVEAKAILENSLNGCYVSKKQKKINRNLYRTMKKRGSLKK